MYTNTHTHTHTHYSAAEGARPAAQGAKPARGGTAQSRAPGKAGSLGSRRAAFFALREQVVSNPAATASATGDRGKAPGAGAGASTP